MPIVLALVFLAVLFVLVRKLRTAPLGPVDARPVRQARPKRVAPSRPVAPDDDPEFLRELGRQLRRKTDE